MKLVESKERTSWSDWEHAVLGKIEEHQHDLRVLRHDMQEVRLDMERMKTQIKTAALAAALVPSATMLGISVVEFLLKL